METSIVIPDHLIEEILLRLPVKHLLPWKCVSKHWYAVIRDYVFAMKHYRFQYAMQLADHGEVPLLLNEPEESPITQFYLLSKHGAGHVVVNITPDFGIPPDIFANHSNPVAHTIHCMGVVNGVVGLRRGSTLVALFNPATREFKEIPRWPIMPDNKVAEMFGSVVLCFGFDLQSNDYKLLGEIKYKKSAKDSDDIFEYHLYSLKANSWKRINDTPRTYPSIQTPITDAYFDNGVHYWTAYELDYLRPAGIVSFNFSTEIFKEFEPPGDADRCHWKIVKYKEGLAVLVDRSEEPCFEVWTATSFRDDDYEVPSSWQLVIKVPSIYAANRLYSLTILDSGDVLISIIDDTETEEGEDVYVAQGFGFDLQSNDINVLGQIDTKKSASI
ncbi:hypothetical protein vseg_007042 [Gypsophila vaccaria]